MNKILGLIFVMAFFAVTFATTTQSTHAQSLDLGSDDRPARAHKAGTNVRANDDTLWLITDVGTRRQYSSEAALVSYEFNNIHAVASMNSRDANLPIGDMILPMEGKVYVQTELPTQGYIYMMSGSTRHTFNSIDVYNALIGYSFENIGHADLNLAIEGYVLINVHERHPKGSLIDDGGIVYYTTEFGRIKVTPRGFRSWNFNRAFVYTPTSGDLGLPIEPGALPMRIPGQITAR